ncbi:FHA domain-containing protein [bacterium]|nr:FHA domain-containing protein [bacterium]RIK77466.1 MAG: hypothetical protein DCC62_09520 [candidate division KSB1 bacterium]
MPKLVLKKRAEVLAEFQLKGTNSVFTIGSEAGNDVVIADKQVSMTHLQIERHGAQYFVRDMKSAFGTYLNNRRIQEKTEVRDGDAIQIGEHTLVFRNPLESAQEFSSENAGSGAINDFWSDVKEAVIDVVQGESALGSDDRQQNRPHFFDINEPSDQERLKRLEEADEFRADSLKKELSEVLEQVSAEEEKETFQANREVEKSPYYLLAIYGPYLGKRYQVNFGETRIGRDGRLNDIIIRENRKGEVDPSISRRHATISYRDSKFYLSDKRSKSRTYLNQDLLGETDELFITPGDEVEIVSDQQSTIFRFVAEGNWDFSYPKRAGAWWLRYRALAINIGTAALSIISAILCLLAWQARSIATHVPSPFKVQSKVYTKLDLTDQEKSITKLVRSDSKIPPKPVLADVNGDQYPDLVVTKPDGALLATDGSSRRKLWQTSSIVLDHSFPAAAGDLNDDGKADLVALTADAHLVAIDGMYGAEIWTSPFFETEIIGPPIIGHFDNDGNPDVAVISVDGRLEVGYSRIFKPEWVEVKMGIGARAPLSAADLDNDGDHEILIGTDRGLVLIFDGVERKLAGTLDINLSLNKLKGSYNEDNQIRHPVGVADLNGDKRLDLVISSRQGNVVVIDVSEKTADGKIKPRELWWSNIARYAGFGTEFSFPFSLGDVNGDGKYDVVAAADDSTLQAFSGVAREGQQQTSLWRVASGKVLHQPALFDFNKDGSVDVVYVEELGVVKILNGKDGSVLWEDHTVVKHPADMPLLADTGVNNTLDILLLNYDGTTNDFRTNRRVPAGTIVWGQRFGDAMNSTALNYVERSPGTYTAALIFGISMIVLVNLGNFWLRQSRRKFAKS